MNQTPPQDLHLLPEHVVGRVEHVVDNVIHSQLVFRSIKVLDIGYITIIYFIFAIIVAKIFDMMFGQYDPEKDKHKKTYKIGIELCGIIWLIGVSTYFARNIIELIPSPFDNIGGFKHRRVKELSSAAVYTLMLYAGSYYFKSKLDTFLARIFSTKHIVPTLHAGN